MLQDCIGCSVYLFVRVYKAWKKIEVIGGQDGEDNIHHGDPQACKWGIQQFCHYVRTTGE